VVSEFILKVASRCNLNCSYCYMYNKGDSSWRDRPSVMADVTFDVTLRRIREHCERKGDGEAVLLFHGGEPTLVGPERFEDLCRRARSMLEDVVAVQLGIQTNGTRLSRGWLDIFMRQDVQVGISMDGPRDIHDAQRVDHRGRPSYDRLARGVTLLRGEGIPFAVLCVIPLGADPVRVHRHFADLGCHEIAYLLPAETHDTVASVRQRFGPAPCADFLIPVFDEWWFNNTLDLRVREFWTIGRLLMGGSSDLDSLGNPPLEYLVVDTDGSIQGLDVLRICGEGMADTGLNVHSSSFVDVAEASPVHAAIIRGMGLPTGCVSCPERPTCAGGYLPHRYSAARGFDNPSVWCEDLLRLFGHIRARMQLQNTNPAAFARAPASMPVHVLHERDLAVKGTSP